MKLLRIILDFLAVDAHADGTVRIARTVTVDGMVESAHLLRHLEEAIGILLEKLRRFLD